MIGDICGLGIEGFNSAWIGGVGNLDNLKTVVSRTSIQQEAGDDENDDAVVDRGGGELPLR